MWALLDVNVLIALLDEDHTHHATVFDFLDDDELEELWTRDGAEGTVYSALRPLLEGTGDVTMPHVLEPETGIGIVAGDMLLSGAEDELSSQWPDCLDGRPRAFRVLSALWRAVRMAAKAIEADLILVDVGPNPGALNRAALVTADHVVVPLAPDLYSI